MTPSRSRTVSILFLLSPLLGSVMLGSCAAGNYTESNSALKTADQANEATLQTAQAPAAEAATDAAPVDSAPRQLPQLIKRATMVLKVETVTEAVQAVAQVIKTHQGDILNLQDSLPGDPSQRQVATLQLRVPQAKLEAALADLAKLGEVQSRSLTAEDVSNQIVDFQARLKNLRSSEERVRKIMDRSGSVADVLKVSQELSNIRASIEQIDAQLQRLKNQVAFSTIDLTVQDAIAASSRQPALGDQMTDSWTHATRAVGAFTTGLLSLGVWLLVFSPYWGGLLLLGWLGKRAIAPRFSKQSPPAVSPAQDDSNAQTQD